jgi:hypothetical protein
MAGFQKLGPSRFAIRTGEYGTDWCYFCGQRKARLVEVFFPENAEHEKKCTTPETADYVRFCRECMAILLGAIDDPDRILREKMRRN